MEVRSGTDHTGSGDTMENEDRTRSGAIMVNTGVVSDNQGTRRRNRLLKVQDIATIDSLIDRVPAVQQLDFLQGVLARIEARKANIHGSGGIFTTRDVRAITLLSEIKDIVQARIDNISVGGTGTISPIITAISIDSILQKEALLWITSNEVGRGYYVILASGATMPTSTQIKAGQNSSGQSIALAGSGLVTNGTLAFMLKNLTANTAYMLYFVAEDTNGTLAAEPAGIPFSTLANDTAPPVISSLSINSVGGSRNAWLMITSDKAGVGYYVVLTGGAGASMPSSAQVKAGQDSTGQTIVFSGSGLIRSGSSQLLLRNLITGTAYTVYFTAENTSGSMLTLPMSTSFIAPGYGPFGPSGRR
ncbi:MAG: hypothetical protein PHH16_04020 [Candidatus Gracilibacteria bacterium]|nr:hypothetical protein [Candidatus Gracilibacteria bacterium]